VGQALVKKRVAQSAVEALPFGSADPVGEVNGVLMWAEITSNCATIAQCRFAVLQLKDHKEQCRPFSAWRE
jgi:hypothetical protein